MTKANVKDIKPGGQFVRIQKQDNGWWAVGHNANGQLVDGTLINHSYPVPMIWADGSHIGLPPGTMPGDGMGG
jgi:hypothetical protein